MTRWYDLPVEITPSRERPTLEYGRQRFQLSTGKSCRPREVQMVIGFSGTGDAPMTPRQFASVRHLIYALSPAVMHFGDCIHADAEAHSIAVEFGIKTVGHPPDNPRKRAFKKYDVEHPVAPYLARNRYIVRDGIDGLIAAPEGATEVRRSGTWATVRYARQAHRHIWIVRPDGTIKEEQP